MKPMSLTRTALYSALGAIAFGGLAGTALAQRDPAYAAARAAGEIGEQVDGYIGIVADETADLRRVVSDINIQRRAVYTDRARAENATLEEMAFSSGCELISRTQPGEMYQTPSGNWQQRTSSPPQRHPSCP